MRLAYRTTPYRKFDIGTALRKIAEVGYDGVELCLENPDISVPVLTKEIVRSVQGVLRETGLGLSSVSLHASYVYDDTALERVKRGIGVAREFDCDVFVTHSGPKRPGDPAETRLRLLDRTRRILDECEKYNVVLAVEPEPAFIVEGTADMIGLMEEIGSDRLCVNLDIGHAFITDEDVCASIRHLGRRLVHTHVEDIAANKEHRHLIPGQGAIDFGAVVSALRSAAYTGYLTVDLFNLAPEEAARPALEVLRRVAGGA